MTFYFSFDRDFFVLGVPFFLIYFFLNFILFFGCVCGGGDGAMGLCEREIFSSGGEGKGGLMIKANDPQY